MYMSCYVSYQPCKMCPRFRVYRHLYSTYQLLAINVGKAESPLYDTSIRCPSILIRSLSTIHQLQVLFIDESYTTIILYCEECVDCAYLLQRIGDSGGHENAWNVKWGGRNARSSLMTVYQLIVLHSTQYVYVWVFIICVDFVQRTVC
jgi:hypothetical protein